MSTKWGRRSRDNQSYIKDRGTVTSGGKIEILSPPTKQDKYNRFIKLHSRMENWENRALNNQSVSWKEAERILDESKKLLHGVPNTIPGYDRDAEFHLAERALFREDADAFASRMNGAKWEIHEQIRRGEV